MMATIGGGSRGRGRGRCESLSSPAAAAAAADVVGGEENSKGRQRHRRPRRGKRVKGGGSPAAMGLTLDGGASAVTVTPSLSPLSTTTTTTTTTTTMIARPEMAFYCFDVLHEFLSNDDDDDDDIGARLASPPPSSISNNDCYPLFVTWKIGKERQLRGCIGTFSPINLLSGLAEYAITSATKDNRFSPITKPELPRLHCSVSLLTKFENRSSYLDWQIGTHGLRIEFLSDLGQPRTATYLPEIPVEQDWTQVQTVDSLLKKGGHQGVITENLRRSIKLTTYQTEKVIVGYADYLKWVRNSRRSANHAPNTVLPSAPPMSSLRTMSLAGQLHLGCVQFPHPSHSIFHNYQTRS